MARWLGCRFLHWGLVEGHRRERSAGMENQGRKSACRLSSFVGREGRLCWDAVGLGVVGIVAVVVPVDVRDDVVASVAEHLRELVLHQDMA